MKKFALISLAILLALSLCACNPDDTVDSIDDYAAKEDTYFLKSGTGTVTFDDKGEKGSANILGYTGDSDEHIVVLDSEIVIENKSNTQKFPVTGIGSRAFYQLTNVKGVIIPDTVTHIDELAFAGCTSLETIVIPASVKTIADYAFAGCTSLESVVFEGTSLISIGNYAFEGCTSLKTTDKIADESTTETGDSASQEDAASTVFVLPEGLETIGLAAFAQCTSITSLVTPGTLKSIGDNAFYGCSSLESVTIGESVTSIGYCAFSPLIDDVDSEDEAETDAADDDNGSATDNKVSITSVTFKNPEGWSWYSSIPENTETPDAPDGDSDNNKKVEILSSDLADTSKAAEYLTTTYCHGYWVQKTEAAQPES